jgi:tetratricopeptide (TPR) repeat protein
MDDIDRIVAAIFSATAHMGKSADSEDYFRAYDDALSVLRARGGHQDLTPQNVTHDERLMGGVQPKPRNLATSINVQRLRALSDSMKYDEALAVLEEIDFDADLAPDLLYYTGVCLGAVDQAQRAIELLKRATTGGYSRFYCAFHLGLFEEKIDNTTAAAYYFTVALILDPARTDVFAQLSRVAPDIGFAPLHDAQAGTPSVAAAREALSVGTEKLQTKELGAAAYYFTTALALDPGYGEARAQLLALAPDISLEVLSGIDMDRLAAELLEKLSAPETDELDLERKLGLVAKVHAIYTQHWQNWHASARSLIPAVEAILDHALATPGMGLDPLCLLYDLLFFLYWYRAADTNAMRGFGDNVVTPFAAAIRDGFACGELPAIARRPLGREPLRLGYLSQFSNLSDGITVGWLGRYLLEGLSRHFPGSYRLALYAWMHYDDASLAPLEAADILVRRFTADSMSERIAAVAEAIAADEIDILITDMNTSLPAVLFERRVAPIQIFYQVGLPFWPLANIDAVFRIDYYDSTLDGFSPSQCFSMGLGPWDLSVLAPEVDAAVIASERARFPQGARLIGTYGRLAKITPDFLDIAAQLLARHSDILVILGGTGDGGWIREFITARGLTGRLEVVEGYVDGHVWGHLLEVFLDTFPQEAGFAGREVMAKSRPVVSLRSPWSEKDRVPMLVVNDREAYADIVSRLIEDRVFYESAVSATRSFVTAGARELDHAAAVANALTAVIGRAQDGSLPPGHRGHTPGEPAFPVH